MAHRSPVKQDAHDSGVVDVAEELDRDGWHVRADVDGHGYDRPPTVNRYTPDVYATREGETMIIEVETEEGHHVTQHNALRRGADQEGAEFSVIVVDDDGTPTDGS